MNEEEARGFLNWQIEKYQSFDVFNDAVGLGIVLRDTSEFIGHCGVGKHDELDEVEIFIGVEKRFRNLNYATEAIDALTKWTGNTFDISHLCATILADNLPSQRAVEKCGYKYVKTMLLDYMGEKVPFKYYRYDF
jgi:RimJ/RimL family protein N-acetyltransferase